MGLPRSSKRGTALAPRRRLHLLVRRQPSVQLVHDHVASGHVCETERKVQETREMHLFAYRPGSVRQEENPVVPVVCVPCRRFAAHIGHDPGNNNVLYSQAAQHGLQIRVVEGRVPVLENNLLAHQRGQVRVDLTLRAPFETPALPPPSHDPAIEVAGMMHVLGEDHREIRSAIGIYDAFHSRENRYPTTREGGRCGIKEEPLHVDHDQGARRHV